MSSRSSSRSSVRSSRSAGRSPQGQSSSANADPELAEYMGKTIAELRQLKAEAIKILDFDTSGKIGEAIRLLSEGGHVDFYKLVETELTEFVDEIFKASDSQINESRAASHEKEMKVRLSTEESFARYIASGEERVKANEVERQLQLEMDKDRKSGEVVRLEEKARTLAKIDNTEAAKETLSSAKELEKEERAKRVAAINAKYDKLTETAVLQTKTDLESLQTRLQTLVARYQEEQQIKENEIFKRTAVQVRAAPQKCIAKILKKEEDLKKDAAKAKRAVAEVNTKLIAFLEKKVQEEGRTFIFEIQAK